MVLWLNILQRLWSLGKCLSIRLRNLCPMLVLTLWRGLYQRMLFRCLFLPLDTQHWTLKNDNIDLSISWRVLSSSSPYNSSSKRYNLCLKEKFLIICRPDLSSLNKRNELVTSCRHRNKALLRNSWTSPSSHPAMFCTYTHFSCCFLVVFYLVVFFLLFF